MTRLGPEHAGDRDRTLFVLPTRDECAEEHAASLPQLHEHAHPWYGEAGWPINGGRGADDDIRPSVVTSAWIYTSKVRGVLATVDSEVSYFSETLRPTRSARSPPTNPEQRAKFDFIVDQAISWGEATSAQRRTLDAFYKHIIRVGNEASHSEEVQPYHTETVLQRNVDVRNAQNIFFQFRPAINARVPWADEMYRARLQRNSQKPRADLPKGSPAPGGSISGVNGSKTTSIIPPDRSCSPRLSTKSGRSDAQRSGCGDHIASQQRSNSRRPTGRGSATAPEAQNEAMTSVSIVASREGPSSSMSISPGKGKRKRPDSEVGKQATRRVAAKQSGSALALLAEVAAPPPTPSPIPSSRVAQDSDDHPPRSAPSPLAFHIQSPIAPGSDRSSPTGAASPHQTENLARLGTDTVSQSATEVQAGGQEEAAEGADDRSEGAERGHSDGSEVDAAEPGLPPIAEEFGDDGDAHIPPPLSLSDGQDLSQLSPEVRRVSRDVIESSKSQIEQRITTLPEVLGLAGDCHLVLVRADVPVSTSFFLLVSLERVVTVRSKDFHIGPDDVSSRISGEPDRD